MFLLQIIENITPILSIFTAVNIDLIGCTTAGEIVDDQLYDNSIAVFLMDIARSNYKIIFEKYDYSSIYDTANTIGQQALNHFENPGLLLLASGLSIDAEQMLAGLKAGVGDNAPIFGGLAGDELGNVKNFCFSQ